jgi:SAM-dependent methyltransferase
MPSGEAVKAWYNQLYATKGLGSMRPREAYPRILDLLDLRPGDRLLDVSCGAGFLLEAADARGVKAYGVDLSDEAVHLARGVARNAGLAVSNGEHLPFRDAAFDGLTCLGSLEHFLDMEQGLREMRRVTRAGARCAIMVPNRHFAGWWLLGRKGTAQQDVQERLLSLGEWSRLFTGHGFALLRTLPDFWHAEKVRVPVVRSLVRLAWRLIPLPLQYQFVFVLRRA